MSDSSDSDDSMSTDDSDGHSVTHISSQFLEFCDNVRNNDPSILPESGEPLRIFHWHLSEKQNMELADALLENNSVTYLELRAEKYTNGDAQAMAKYVRTSKCLQRIRWFGGNYRRRNRHYEEIMSVLLPAIQESTSLKELQIDFPLIVRPGNLVLEMLTHTQSLRSLSLICPYYRHEEGPVAKAQSGFKTNSTLQELTLEFSRHTTVSPIWKSLRDHPLLRRLCLHGHVDDLTGIHTLLLSDTSKIAELEISVGCDYIGPPMMGLTLVLQALARRPTLTKLRLNGFRLNRYNARQLRLAVCHMLSLHTLALTDNTLGSAGFAELAPALCRNTSIKVLDMSGNSLDDTKSAELLWDILRSNKVVTTLGLSGNKFGETTSTVECIADGLGSNSTLLKIDLSRCALEDGGVSILAQTLGSRNTTLQKLNLSRNDITSTGIRVLLEMTEQSSHINDLDLEHNPIGIEGASLLARALEDNSLPNLKRLSLSDYSICDDGFIALVSALEQNTSLVQLDLRYNNQSAVRFSERAFLALAESLPEIKVLQRFGLNWCTGLASAMPPLLEGLRENTSLFRIHVEDCAPYVVPPTAEDMAKCAGGWMQEMERLGYRNRCRSLMIRAPNERLPPRGVWPRALARVAKLPDVIFEVLRSKPSLVPSEDTEG